MVYIFYYQIHKFIFGLSVFIVLEYIFQGIPNWAFFLSEIFPAKGIL